MSCRQIRWDPTLTPQGLPRGMREYAGDELLFQASNQGYTDQYGNMTAAEIAGATYLMQMLTREYGLSAQDLSVASLDSFFSFTRGQLSLNVFLTMWRLCFDEAQANYMSLGTSY